MSNIVGAPSASGSATGLGSASFNPWLTAAKALQAGGTLASGLSQAKALQANAGAYRAEAATAADQGFQQESQIRREGAQRIGQETAAVGQSGTGYGGSNSRLIAQNALNVQLDALNTRYKSQLQKWSYQAQASNLDYEARQARVGGFLNAGAALLKGASGNYTTD